MGARYTFDELLRLRESPLVIKPSGLPPAEQWMGPLQDSTHQANRRPQHISRNSANPEDIILGPPKTSFMSSTARRNDNKGLDTDHSLRDADSRDRFNFRNKTGDGETDRLRDGRNNMLRPKRADGDQDSDGWSTVKPRKSFGTEGAERFNGRMGVDRHRDDRRFKDREDRDTKDRPTRGFENFSREAREKDVDHDLNKDSRRNGAGRGRNESWFRGDNDGPTPAPRDRNSNGEKFGNRGWREKNNDEQDRGNRNDRADRRWDRNDRHEPEPAWMDEPADEKNQAHTQEDFQKWKEAQQSKDRAGKTPAEEAPPFESSGGVSGLDKPKFETPLAIDTGPDKFFGMWATPKDENGPDSAIESKREGSFFPVKAKNTGKASRFTSFFTPAQEDLPRRQTEPPPSMPVAPAGGLAALFQNGGQGSGDPSEKEAFQQLLQKLQRQTVSSSGSTPPANILQQPKPPAPEKKQTQPTPPPEQFQQYRHERQEVARPSASTRNSQQALQDLLSQRQVSGSQPTIKPEQMLQELVGQRQHALSQASVRPDQPQNRSNTDFLMNLMKGQPEPQRSEQILLRMPGSKPVDRQMDRQMQHQQMMEREQEMQREAAARERSASQRQARPPPGFFDESFQQRGPPSQHERPPQPTQILQRPPPPGLDQMQPGWAPPVQQLRQQQQHIAPPPGLAARGMPQQMFPPGFPGMGNFPPPEVMAGPRGMPSFFQGPPPGFMPPGFQGPEGMAFGGPFDGRGPPPNGSYRRQ
ncbi:hypothetical protein D0Z07_0618 [Hyphodiscus hymeniophilus]|uniref:Uncharacterized protein n=1 Tax=Hyphodiscus hymeniophilus TaxID=353542 RepID=A0A9P7B0W6_9HELO|nr:hypothetical protein D0Z07_0618 [Hyphodiscus hymeniophilus]